MKNLWATPFATPSSIFHHNLCKFKQVYLNDRFIIIGIIINFVAVTFFSLLIMMMMMMMMMMIMNLFRLIHPCYHQYSFKLLFIC